VLGEVQLHLYLGGMKTISSALTTVCWISLPTRYPYQTRRFM